MAMENNLLSVSTFVDYIHNYIKHVALSKNANVKNTIIKSVLTDSRSLACTEGIMFAALQTEVNDGHKYIPELYNQGVRIFLVENMPHDIDTMSDAFFIQVSSVIDSLEALAMFLVENATYMHFVVTGSYGKSAVKEILYTSALPHCRAAHSPRSFNSRLGIILSLIENTLGKSPELIITEAGIDGPGQADKVLRLFTGHLTGIITPITEEHDRNFPSHKDKVSEKLRMLENCDTIVYDSSDKDLVILLRQMQSRKKNLRLIPVDSNSINNESPTIYHALAKAALPDYYNSSVSVVSPRIGIRCCENGNMVVRDDFTPDLRSLRDVLDTARRQATPTRPCVAILGDILHHTMTLDEIYGLYASAFELCRLFGFQKVYYVGCELRDSTFIWPANVIPLESSTQIASLADGNTITDSLVLLFGKNNPELDCLAASLESASHETSLEIDLDALTANYNIYRRMLPQGTGIVGMVKADAYGTGAVEIGKTLQSIGAAYLAVAVIDEGISLRKAGITMPIMVLNPITNRYPALFAHKLEPAVFSIEELKRLIAEAESAGCIAYPVHVKLDTGMHRVGFVDNQLGELCSMLGQTEAVRIESVFSHLATADCLDKDDYTAMQLEAFYQMTDAISKRLGRTFKRHILNTAGMMRFSDCGPYEMARLGIGLYGISPYSESRLKLKTVATFRSRIISLKRWPAGTPIGYGCKGRTDRESIIATVPVGYADGIDRHMGRGAASFVVKGVECPTIGNICMDLCMIDVTDVCEPKVGDSVEIFGKEMPIKRIANTLGTIPYEILTSVSPRVKRIYTRK